MTQPLTTDQLEELLEHELPCGGWAVDAGEENSHCERPAALRSRGHGCRPEKPRLKCLNCWQAWYIALTAKAARRGARRGCDPYLVCCRCKRHFLTVAAFSDYRPF